MVVGISHNLTRTEFVTVLKLFSQLITLFWLVSFHYACRILFLEEEEEKQEVIVVYLKCTS